MSFFSGIGKSHFFKVFLENAKFILGNHPGSFNSSFSSSDLYNQTHMNQLAFIRLVGCAYYKKHINAFYGHTPESLLNSFAGASSPTQQHSQWLDYLRQGIWDRIAQENETIPSFTALQLHWLRSCWVLHMWQQAQCNNMMLVTLNGNGWLRKNDGEICIVWDTE